jgi:hypothetical protein
MLENVRTYHGRSYRIVNFLFRGEEVYGVQEQVTVRRWFRKRTEWVDVGIHPVQGTPTRVVDAYPIAPPPFFQIISYSPEGAEEKYRNAVDQLKESR